MVGPGTKDNRDMTSMTTSRALLPALAATVGLALVAAPPFALAATMLAVASLLAATAQRTPMPARVTRSVKT